MSEHLPFDALHAMDLELTRLVRAASTQKYALGVALEALARRGGHHALGFSSIEAYALERCERSARWTQQARALARQLESLPAIRTALLHGHLSFSMAALLARVACADDEATWLQQAQTRTVRQMQALLRERDPSTTVASASAEDSRATLTLTVNREDAWLLECATMIVRHTGGATREDTLEALVGEGSVALFPQARHESLLAFDDDTTENLAQQAWTAQLAEWRDEAEARCEPAIAERIRRHDTGRDAPAAQPGEWHDTAEARRESTTAAHTRVCDTRREAAARDVGAPRNDNAAIDVDVAPGIDATTLDSKLRALAAELARRDVSIGHLAERFWKADGWRRLGFATETQYCRERLGCSLSSIKTKRALARRITALPELNEALEARKLGYEATRLVAAVATAETVTVWIERAHDRTVRFLRDEIDAAQMIARLGGTTHAVPPSDDTMNKVTRVEASIVSGELFRTTDPESQISAALAELVGDAPTHRHRPAAQPQGRVTLRFRVARDLARYYRTLERTFRQSHASIGFVRFLCTALIDSWRHTLGTQVAHAHIYARDRYRCTNPVCCRRDITPHHLRFRSQQGDDSASNLTSLCVWCHLEGIHAGRLRATPPASNITWTIGASAHTLVQGRRRIRQAA